MMALFQWGSVGPGLVFLPMTDTEMSWDFLLKVVNDLIEYYTPF